MNLLEPLKEMLYKNIKYILSKKNLVIISYNGSQLSKVFELIKEIKKEKEMLLLENEAYQIFMAVKRTQKIEGDLAEVGTYQGCSAKLICESKGNKILHVFDTFEGLPEPSDKDNRFKKGDYKDSLESVKDYLSEYKNINFYKGFFPETARPIKDKKFSFVNLDVDLYQSTLDGLKFFYQRMNKGG